LNRKKLGACLTVAVVALGTILAFGVFNNQAPSQVTSQKRNSNSSSRYETPPSEWHSPPKVSIGQGFGVGKADYIVFKGSEGNIYAKSGDNGQIMFESDNAAKVIQSAIDSMDNTAWSEVLVKDNLTITSQINLRSYTIFKLQGKLTLDKDYFVNMLEGTHIKNVAIIGHGTFDGNRKAHDPSLHTTENHMVIMRFDNVDNLIVRDVHAYEPLNCCLDIVGAGGGDPASPWWNTNVIVDGVHFNNRYELGEGGTKPGEDTIEFKQVEQARVVNSYIAGCRNLGLELEGSRRVTVQGNVFKDIGGENGARAAIKTEGHPTGTEIIHTSHVVIDSNYFENNTTNVTLNGSPSHITVSNNTMENTRSGYNAIGIVEGSGIVISNNSIENFEASGIFVGGGSGVLVEGNALRDNDGDRGIDVQTPEVSVNNNRLFNCPICGYSEETILSGNFIENDLINFSYGIIDGSVISQNTVENGALVIGNPAEGVKIVNNTFNDGGSKYGGVYTGLRIESGLKSSVISQNTVKNMERGIYLGPSGENNEIVGNLLKNLAYSGVVTRENMDIFRNNSFVNCASPHISENVRTVIDGKGFNDGDPSSAGQWNGYASWVYEHGVKIYDTSATPDNIYVADSGGNWIQIG